MVSTDKTLMIVEVIVFILAMLVFFWLTNKEQIPIWNAAATVPGHSRLGEAAAQQSATTPAVITNNSVQLQVFGDHVVINIYGGKGSEETGEGDEGSLVERMGGDVANTVKDDECCPICFMGYGNENFSMWMILPKCKHRFHFDCIGIWLKNNNTCPICRDMVN